MTEQTEVNDSKEMFSLRNFTLSILLLVRTIWSIVSPKMGSLRKFCFLPVLQKIFASLSLSSSAIKCRGLMARNSTLK